MPKRYSTRKIIEALRATSGAVYLAARQVGCSPRTIYNRAQSSAAVRQAIEDSRGELVDISELKLRAAVMNDQPWAIALVLKTLGRERGYVERQETVNKSETLEVVTRVVRRNEDRH